MFIVARARQRLGTKLTVLFLVLSLVPLTVVGILAYGSSRQTIEAQQFAHLNAINLLKAGQLNRWLLDEEQMLESLGQRPLLRAYAGTIVQSGGIPYPATYHSLLDDHLLPALAEKGGFEQLFLLDGRDGRVLVSTEKAMEGENQENEPYFLLGQQQTHVQNVYYSLARGRRLLTIGTPVRNDEGETVAVLAGHVNLAELGLITAHTNELTASQDTYLVNASNFFVTDPRFGQGYALQQEIYTEGVIECLQQESGQRFYTNYRGRPVLGAFRWLPERELCILTEIDQAEAFAPIEEVLQSTLVVGSLATLGILIAGIFFARTISAPLRRLLRGTERIGGGDLDYRLPVQGQDEIGQLSEAFNRMAANLRQSLGETAHGRRLVLALSTAAQAVQRAQVPEEVYETVGQEVAKLGFSATVLLLDDQQHLRLAYLGYDPALVRVAEKLTGLSHTTYRFPLPEGGFYDRVIEDQEPLFLESMSDFISEAVPNRVQPIARRIAALLGMEQGIVAALAVDGQALGLLTVTGAGLSKHHLPAVSAFANQAAISLQNAHLYEQHRQNEAHFRHLANAMPQLVWTAQADGTFDYFNERRYELDGLGSENDSWQWEKAVHPDDIELSTAAWQAALTSGELYQVEQRVRRRDGNYHWYLSRAVPVRDEAGEIVRWYGTSTDIQQQKENEEALRRHREGLELLMAERTAELRQSEARFRALFDAAPMPMMVSRIDDGLVLEANESVAATLRLPGGSLIGSSTSSYYQEPDARAAFVKKLRENGSVRNHELLINRQDDEKVWLLASAVPIEYKGESALLSGFIDVTERKRMEQTLRYSEERFRALVQNASDIITIVQADGAIIYDSPSLEKVLGYHPDERLGQNVITVAHPEDQDKAKAAFASLLHRPANPVHLEVRVRHKDGSWRVLEVKAANLLDNPAVRGIVINSHDVTLRKEAEDALRRQRDRFNRLLETSPVGITLADQEGQITFANPQAEKVLGFSREDVPEWHYKAPGWRITDYAGQPLPEEQLPFVRARTSGRPVYDVQHAVEKPDGQRLYLSINATPVFNEDGDFDGIVASIQDITMQKQAEEELREREELWRTIFADSPIGKAIVSLDYRFDQVNPRLCEILGYTEEELLALSFPEITYPADLAADVALAERLIRGEIPRYSIEKRYIRKDGTIVWSQLTGTVIRDEEGVAQFAFAMIEDIHERKLMEEALRQNEALLSNMLEHLPVGIWLIDHHGQIVKSNPAAQQIWEGARYVGPEQYGEYKGWWLDSGRPIAPGEWAAARAMQKGETYLNEEVEIECFDGSQKIILNSAVPLRNNGAVTGAIIVNHDITDLKRVQAQLEANAEELARSNKELQQFAYIASHDLQEPLRMVSSFLELLQRRYAGQLDAAADEYIHYAVDGAARMRGLINDLLQYSRVATKGDPFIPIDSQEMLDTVLSDFQVTIEEQKATITCEPLPVIIGDASQIRQLFQNVLGNAIKFHGEEQPRIHVSVAQKDKMWQFAVSDNGIGIDTRHVERIFIIFQRLHAGNVYPGTGIGLAICKKIVERHGGAMWVESEPGAGSTFFFTLPALGDNNDDHS